MFSPSLFCLMSALADRRSLLVWHHEVLDPPEDLKAKLNRLFLCFIQYVRSQSHGLVMSIKLWRTEL